MSTPLDPTANAGLRPQGQHRRGDLAQRPHGAPQVARRPPPGPARRVCAVTVLGQVLGALGQPLLLNVAARLSMDWCEMPSSYCYVTGRRRHRSCCPLPPPPPRHRRRRVITHLLPPLFAAPASGFVVAGFPRMNATTQPRRRCDSFRGVFCCWPASRHQWPPAAARHPPPVVPLTTTKLIFLFFSFVSLDHVERGRADDRLRRCAPHRRFPRCRSRSAVPGAIIHLLFFV